jgi:LysM repeat protein
MTRKIILTGGLLAFAVILHAQPNAEVIQYITSFRQLAIDEMVRTGVPASITLAQGIHESEAGKSGLVQRSNNHFGIKCKSNWNGERVYHNDDEANECFRSYPSAAESYKDHSDFLLGNPRYQFLFKLDPEDYAAWAQGLKKAGYATNEQYAPLLIKLIETYNLQQFTLVALGKLAPEQEILSGTKAPAAANAEKHTGVMNGGPYTDQEFEELPPIDYPEGVFRINDTRVILAPAGSSLLALAEQYGLSLEHLLDFNDLQQSDVLPKAQLIYLQRKRKKGNTPYHIVQKGESLYHIAQSEGIRLESIEKYNGLGSGAEPAWGEKVYLQGPAPEPPRSMDNLVMNEPKQNQPGALKEKQSDSNPAKLIHKVQPKETLYSISRRYGTTVEQLMSWNGLGGQRIRQGQELIIYNQRP